MLADPRELAQMVEPADEQPRRLHDARRIGVYGQLGVSPWVRNPPFGCEIHHYWSILD